MPRKHIGDVEVELHIFLTSALYGGELWTSRTGRFNSGKEPRNPLNRRLVGPTAGQEKNYFAPGGIRTPDRPAHILVTILTELSLLR